MNRRKSKLIVFEITQLFSWENLNLLSTYFTTKKLYIWKIVKFIFLLNPEGNQGYIARLQLFFKPVKIGEDRSVQPF